MTNETAEILRKARALVEKGWCRNEYARDSRNQPTWALSKDAVKFCAAGAMTAAAGSVERAFAARAAFSGAIPQYLTLQDFNDRSSNKRPVLRAFDRAIAAAEKSDA
jgi:hypothetical protein